MKALVVVVLLGVAGFGVYKFGFASGDDETVKTYEAFMKALRTTRLTDAKAMTSGEQADEDIDTYTKREAQLFRDRGSLNIHRALYTLQEQSTEGDVTLLTLREELRMDPPGSTSAIGSINVWLRHEVEMKKIGGVWKILAFSYEFDHVEAIDGVDTDDVERWF